MNQKGFTLVEGVLIILAISVISFGGYYVITQQEDISTDNSQVTQEEHEQNDMAASQTRATTYTDTTGTYKITYPDNWKKIEYKWQDCCEGPRKEEPDWSKTPQPVELKPVDAAHQDIAISITADTTGAITIDGEWAGRTLDQFNTYEKFQINGYDALYQKTDFIGPAEVEAYIDHRYVVVDGNHSVEITFREKYRHDWNNEDSGGKTNFDASQYMADFNGIAYSVTFL